MRVRELNVGCVGGGTGLPSLLGGLKLNPWLTVNAVVTVVARAVIVVAVHRTWCAVDRARSVTVVASVARAAADLAVAHAGPGLAGAGSGVGRDVGSGRGRRAGTCEGAR